MQDLISQYKEGRRQLREQVKRLTVLIRESDDPADLMDLEHDRSILNGMIRDMTDAIGMMRDPFFQPRGAADEKDEILMDPVIMSSIYSKEEEPSWDPENEDHIRQQVLERFEKQIKERLDLLTNKQRSTLHRWIFDEKSMSQIALEDGVSRQAIYQRIFGNKTHSGAISKLKEGR